MSLRTQTCFLVAVLALLLLGAGLAVDLWLVGPWLATLETDAADQRLRALASGTSARRVALVWVVLAWAVVVARVLDRRLAGPVTELTAAVTSARVSGTGSLWAGAPRQDELGTLAREFEHTRGELAELRAESARASAHTAQLERKLAELEHLGEVVRHLSVSARRLKRALASEDHRLLDLAASLTAEVAAEVAALDEMVRGISPASGPAPGSIAAPAGSTTDPPPEAAPC